MPDYTRVNLRDVEDQAAKHGFGDHQEARFPREALGLEASGVGHLRVKPNQRQPFAHRHNEAEEVHVVLEGSGRVKLDDEVIDVGADDVIRIVPASPGRSRRGRTASSTSCSARVTRTTRRSSRDSGKGRTELSALSRCDRAPVPVRAVGSHSPARL